MLGYDGKIDVVKYLKRNASLVAVIMIVMKHEFDFFTYMCEVWLSIDYYQPSSFPNTLEFRHDLFPNKFYVRQVDQLKTHIKISMEMYGIWPFSFPNKNYVKT